MISIPIKIYTPNADNTKVTWTTQPFTMDGSVDVND